MVRPRRGGIPRSALVPEAKYDASGMGRRLARWNPSSTGPNTAIKGLQKIRDRAADVVRNDWAGSTTRKWTTTLVGTGIVPRWKDERIEPLWNEWVPEADADGVLDVYGMQTLAVRTWLNGGEVFIRRRSRRLDAPLSAPLQVQLLEGEMCPLLDATSWPGLPAGNEIRQGIEINRYGRRVAYWFYKAHPGDANVFGATARPDDLVRVAASDVRHMFEPSRVGQLRGVPMLANVLVRLRNAADLEDNVLDRQKLANLFTMFITRQLSDKWLNDVELDPITGMPAVWNADGNMTVGLEPGTAFELKPGEDVKFTNPPEAGTTYSDYMRTLGLGTASGSDMPYELFSGDIKDISDRALRVIINEYRRFAEQRQWQIIIPMLAQPFVQWWAEAMLLAGKMGPALAAAARKPKHSPHGWEYIHPVQDVEGKIKAIEAGLTSRDAVIGSRGDDPRTVDRERAEGRARERELTKESTA